MSWTSLFVKDDEPKKETADASVESTEVVAETEQVAPEFNFNYKEVAEAGPVSEGVYVEDIAGHLWEILEATKQNMAYFDFLKAKKAMDALKLDEAAKFQATFVSLSTQGLTKEGLVDAIEEHLAKLDSELEKFQGAVEQKRQAEVTSREEQIEKNNALALSKSEQIQALTEEITELQSNNTVLEAEVKEETDGITSSTLNFETTVNSVKGEINVHKDQVELYLSQGTKQEEETNG